jgi:hypothetical protein
MTLWDIYSLVSYISNKDFSGDIITPERFKELLPVVSIDLFRKKYGLPEGYQPGRPIPKEFADITLKNTDDLKAFKVFTQNATVINGVLSYPTDYCHRDAITYNFVKVINGVSTELPRPVEILREEQFYSRMGNYTKRATLSNPIGVVRSYGIYIEPYSITNVDWSYYRFPVDPVFAYTIGDGFITYDAANSIEFEYPKDEHLTLVRMILQYVGVNLRESDLVQYSEQKLQNG